jgi:hypothetical protein
MDEWSVCKYNSRQPHIWLENLSDAGRISLANEFGISIIDDRVTFFRQPFKFYDSPAFSSLKRWAEKHPRKIKTYGISSYVGDWVGRALEPTPLELQPIDTPSM